MKTIVKTIFVIIILSAFSREVIAQTSRTTYVSKPVKDGYKNKLFAGLSFGLTGAWWGGARDEYIQDVENELKGDAIFVDFSAKPRFSMSFAFLMEYCFTKNLRLYTEVAYVNKGQCYSGDGYMLYQEYYGSQQERFDFFMRMKMRVNYIQIPLMFKVVTNEGFFFAAGPHLDITTHGKIFCMVKAGGEGDSNAEKMPMLRRVNFGLSAGLGFQKNGLGFDIRYISDLADTYQEGANPYNLKNRMIQISMVIIPGQID